MLIMAMNKARKHGQNTGRDDGVLGENELCIEIEKLQLSEPCD